jgi:1-acyl-sn-glycerol-3-phosphate acyltransferase
MQPNPVPPVGDPQCLNTDPQLQVVDPRDRKAYYFHRTPVRLVVEPALKHIFSLFGVIQSNGEDKLPSVGPVIVAANHLTNYDVFPLQFALPRPLFYMGKEELFRNPVLDWLLRQLGAFPVYRGARDEWAMRHAEKVLEQGNMLGIFPEGSRSKGEGLKPAKTGAARLAQTIQCPIVPVALYGTQFMFRDFPSRATIQVTVGDPIYPQSGDTHLELTDRLMFTLAAMMPPELRGVYQVHPAGF